MRLDQQLIDFVIEHHADDIHKLALQAKHYSDIDMQLAIRIITGRNIAKEKIPSWHSCPNILYPKHLSMEQCSSEQTARFKSSLYKANSMVDLTGGFGVDCFFLSHSYMEATYVEQQKELSDIAAYNFSLLNKNIKVVNDDAIHFLSSMSSVDLIYIDPARRDDIGRKTVRIEDCTPNILEIESLLDEKCEVSMIKLSPMLDISLAVNTLRSISDVYIISVDNECKELLLIRKKDYKDKLHYHCVNLSKTKNDIFTYTKQDEDDLMVVYTNTIGKYLYEPNSSILKAGAYKSISKCFGLEKLHASSHLYTSEQLCDNFQGRKFIVEAVCSLNKKELKQYIPDNFQANVTVRNFPLSVKEIRKKTGLKDGGDLYVFATTLADNKKVLILCKKA